MEKERQKIRPVVNQVARILRQRVSHGQYHPGDFFPSERSLANELNVSRMSVSRAMEQLAREGIVEQHIGAGSFIRPDAFRHLPPGSIAVLHPVFKTPHSPEGSLILEGIVDTLVSTKFTYNMIPVAENEYAGPVERIIRPDNITQLGDQYGGFLFIEGFFPDAIKSIQSQDIPIVVANLESDMKVSSTWVNHLRIASMAVEFLVALGHRRIGLVASVPDQAFYRKTLQGYRDALKKLKLPNDESLFGLCRNSSPLEAYTATRKLLQSSSRPTAIVAGRDLHAEGICRAATELGFTIGRDLSVIGYDDVSWVPSPTFLTTFQEPCYELGAIAVKMLIQRMRNPRKKVENREITAPLIIRRSAGPPVENKPDSIQLSLKLQSSIETVENSMDSTSID